MKRCIKNTILITIAPLLLLFGNTVTICHFCCDACRSQGREIIAESQCHVLVREIQNAQNNNALQVHSAICHGNCFADISLEQGDEHGACSEEIYSITLDNQTPDFRFDLPVGQSSSIIPQTFIRIEQEPILVNYNIIIQGIPLSGRQILEKNCVSRT